jgi:tRNA pseudouridine38-40 synthase
MIIEDVEIIKKLNTFLPPQIRVWDFVRTKNNFHAKNACDSRIYEYLLPSYALMNCDETHYPFSKVAVQAGVDPTSVFAKRKQYEVIDIPDITAEGLAPRRAYRVTAEKLERLRAILQEFVGTKNHHNFTVGKAFDDRSANRYILSFTVLIA